MRRGFPVRRVADRHRIESVAYVRVSSKEQDREGFSIPAQRKLLRAYADDHGFHMLREFEDVETAKQVGRPGFASMVKFLEATPSCRVVLVEKVDRLYRNLKDWVTIDGLSLEIHFAKENVILSDDSRSSEKFMHGIRVLMAKNYCDNLSEEVRKGLSEKAAQGHWPTVAHIGYVNNRETKRIEPDPERGPLVARLFERYACRDISLKGLVAWAYSAGLTHPRSGRRLTRSEIHRVLHDHVYYGDFRWNGDWYHGSHQPIISRDLFEQVQAVFAEGNRPKYTKHRHAFAGIVTCGRCGCAMTAELKKGRYVYYHCTGARGVCGNTYVREEELSRLLAEAVRRVQIPTHTADLIAEALRQSQADKEKFHRTALLTLQQRQVAVQAKLDRAYDDRLAGTITAEMWKRKAGEWEAELADVRREMARHENASHDYSATGSQVLELAQNAYGLFTQQKPDEQAKLLRTLLSNCTFDRGSLCPTYSKPFDLLVRGNETEDWLGGRDSNPDNVVQSHGSYR